MVFMRHEIENAVTDVIRAAEFLRDPVSLDFIETASAWIAECFQSGGKILLAGNGGSLCDAMHFAEELTGVFRKKRKALPAIVLSEPGHMTCIGNDLGFDEIFSRGIEAFGRPEDIAVLLTTSGNSSNIVKAADCAKKMGLKTIAFLGKNGGECTKGATSNGSFPASDIPTEFRKPIWQQFTLSLKLLKNFFSTLLCWKK